MRALAAGEMVGIFPECRLTEDGDLHAFRPGVQQILAAHPLPPERVTLDGLRPAVLCLRGEPR